MTPYRVFHTKKLPLAAFLYTNVKGYGAPFEKARRVLLHFLHFQRKISSGSGDNIHLDGAVCHRLMVDVQLIVQRDVYIFVCHLHFHTLGVYTHKHLTIRSLVISKILPVFFKNHM